MKAVYAGSFDPITRGHLSIIKRAAKMFDLTIGVANNAKKKQWIGIEDRKRLVEQSLTDVISGSQDLRERCRVETVDGLLANFCTKNDIRIIVRGLRNTIDFEYEFGMAHVNKLISMVEGSLETVFLVADEKETHISSSVVRELFEHGANTKLLVPSPVEELFNQWREK